MLFERLTVAQEETLLGRRVRELLTPAVRRAFAGARCLVTGAGGSIGSELARRIAACGPASLTLVDHSELLLFDIDRELQEEWPDVLVRPVLADVTRRRTIDEAVASAEPDVVFHAAAYKHVTMAEQAVCAAARVNVLGTAHVRDAARRAGAAFILISSDKAAAPASVMGATKRLAEAVALRSDRPAHASVVRFGNVLASSGSFVAIARDCLRRGRAIPLTDPGATRYFMTVAEAASLVMAAAARARGGETFWLDMGTPIRMGDLVERLMKMAARAVPVTVVGLRDGEKRAEQLVDQDERTQPTGIPYVMETLRGPRREADVAAALAALSRAVARGDAAATLRLLAAAVPGYRPSLQAAGPACRPIVRAA